MLNFDLFRKGSGNSFSARLCAILQEKCFSSYTLFTDQISLPDCPYFLRYW